MNRMSNELEKAISEIDENIKSMKRAGKILANAYIRERGDNWREYDTHGIIESFLKEDSY